MRCGLIGFQAEVPRQQALHFPFLRQPKGDLALLGLALAGLENRLLSGEIAGLVTGLIHRFQLKIAGQCNSAPLSRTYYHQTVRASRAPLRVI